MTLVEVFIYILHLAKEMAPLVKSNILFVFIGLVMFCSDSIDVGDG